MALVALVEHRVLFRLGLDQLLGLLLLGVVNELAWSALVGLGSTASTDAVGFIEMRSINGVGDFVFHIIPDRWRADVMAPFRSITSNFR